MDSKTSRSIAPPGSGWLAKRIAAKYRIRKRPVKMPLLVFLGTLGMRTVDKAAMITSICRSFRSHFNLSFHVTTVIVPAVPAGGDVIEQICPYYPIRSSARTNVAGSHSEPFSILKVQGSRSRIVTMEEKEGLSPGSRKPSADTVFSCSFAPVIVAASQQFLYHVQRIAYCGASKPKPQEGLTGSKTGYLTTRAELIASAAGASAALWKKSGPESGLRFHRGAPGAGALGADLKAAEGALYFHTRRIHQDVVQKIEEMKKTVAETKKMFVDQSSSLCLRNDAEIKKHLDIDSLSDQVYRNLERRIRAERERRGL